jgi:hypothetical protein
MVYLFHVMFAVCMVVLVWAMNNAAEKHEILVRGLALAQKADAEAARIRMTMAFEAQQEATDKLRKLVEGSQCAIHRSESLLKGSGMVRGRGTDQPVGHEAKKGPPA